MRVLTHHHHPAPQLRPEHQGWLIHTHDLGDHRRQVGPHHRHWFQNPEDWDHSPCVDVECTDPGHYTAEALAELVKAWSSETIAQALEERG